MNRSLIFFILTVYSICFMTGCNSTHYLSPDNCYTCWPIIYDNQKYSEEEFGYKKREQDSIFEEYIRTCPQPEIPDTLKGDFRVREIWKNFDVVVLFLEDLSCPTDPLKKFKQVISMADKPYYRGEVIRVGKVYYFEIIPIYPVNKTPSLSGQADELFFENHWLLIHHFCGDNIYSSTNLNGDKYRRISRKNKLRNLGENSCEN